MLTPLASGAPLTEPKLVESAGTAPPIWIDAGVGLLLNGIMIDGSRRRRDCRSRRDRP